MIKRSLALLFLLSILAVDGLDAQEKFRNRNLPVQERVEDLVSRMTIQEKVAQLSSLTPAIERLGVIDYPAFWEYPTAQLPYIYYDLNIFLEKEPWKDLSNTYSVCMDGGYCNEALHGIARSGMATVFPQAIGLGSTWNPSLMKQVATVISDEARAHNAMYGKRLTYWSPTINMLRDPRWGRTEEAYSEDPYLMARMAVAFVQGMQGDNPHYLKTVATVKHFAANNCEQNRHYGSADVSERILREYYFPAFKAAVQEGKVASLMTAYNAVNGIPVSVNSWLIQDILRDEWGFQGFIVSDCGAISDIINGHKYETDKEKAVALAVKTGTDIECEFCQTEQFLYDKFLYSAFQKGYITEAEIDASLKRIFTVRFRLGEFDNPADNPYSKITANQIDKQEYRDLNLNTARESIILLKNENNLLPLDKNTLRKIAVIGPNADVAELGGYSGEPSFSISPLSGIREKTGFQKTVFEPGCRIAKTFPTGIERAQEVAKTADVVVVVLGTNLTMANEELDRTNLGLPQAQIDLLKAVYAVNKNVVLTLVNGMPIEFPWAYNHIPAIIEAWYPGAYGGLALADVLFGDYNPAGRLPVTIYQDASQLPDIEDYDITKGRTYWYFKGDVSFPFGHGLSYTRFEYSPLTVSPTVLKKDKNVNIGLKVSNTGSRAGDEVVQLYIRQLNSKYIQPNKKLRKFSRQHILAQSAATIDFKLTEEDFSFWNPTKKKWEVEKGDYEIQVGASSEDIRQTIIIKIN